MTFNKLSDVSPCRTLMLNENEVDYYVFKPERVEIDVDKKYDIALVLGCKILEIMQKRVADAIKLYRDGIIDKLLLSGGIGFFSLNIKSTEAIFMRQYALSMGVSDSDIIIEDRSRNTYENMKNSLIQIENGYSKEGQIVVVTSDFHSKRSKGMLEKMTKCNIYSYGVLDGKNDLEIWNHYNLATKRLIMEEALLLSLYVKKGIVDDQEIMPINKVLRK